MKRKGGANELTTQLFQLKEENNKLKQLAGQVGEVQRLRQENKQMKIELQKMKMPSLTDGFQQQSRMITDGGMISANETINYNN